MSKYFTSQLNIIKNLYTLQASVNVFDAIPLTG